MAHKQITTQKETLRDGEQQKRYSATEHDGCKHHWNTIKIIALLGFLLSGEQLNNWTNLLDISLYQTHLWEFLSVSGGISEWLCLGFVFVLPKPHRDFENLT